MINKYRGLITALIIVLTISGMFCGLRVASIRAKDSAIERAKIVLLDSGREQNDTLVTLFESNFLYLEMIAISGTYEENRTDAETEQMLDALEQHSKFSFAFVIGMDGKVLFGDNKGDDAYADSEFYKEALKGFKAMGNFKRENSEENVVVLAVPYIKNEEIIGVLCGMYNQQSLMDALSSQAFEGQGYSYIADSSGNVIVNTTSEHFLLSGQNQIEFFKNKDIKFEKGVSSDSVLKSLKSREKVSFYFSYLDDARVFTAIPFGSNELPENDWILCNVVASGSLYFQILSDRTDMFEVVGVIIAFIFVALLLFLILEHDNRNQLANIISLKENFLNNLPCGAGIYKEKNGNLELVYLNQKYLELVGREHSEEDYKNLFDVVFKEDVPMFSREIEAAIAENRDAVCQSRLLVKDGNYTPFKIICHIVNEENGERTLNCLFFPVEDGEFKAVRERQEIEARYRALVDNTGGGLTITEIRGSEGSNFFVSDGMLRLMHIEKNEYMDLYGKNIYSKIYPEDREIARSLFAKIRKNGESETTSYRLIRGDGTYIWVNVTVRFASENGKEYLYAVYTDISEQKNIELREKKAFDQLTFLNKVAGDLLCEKDAESSIGIILANSLEHFKGNRAYVFEFDNEAKIAHNTYELCSKNVVSTKDMLKNVPFSTFTDWFDEFAIRGYIAISDVTKLDDSRINERELLQAQNISSLVVVPLKIGHEIIGMMGVDDPKENIDQTGHLQAIGDYMAVMILRRNMINELQENNQRMKVMMNDTPGGFAQFIINPDNQVVPCFLNDGFLKMLGYKDEQTDTLLSFDFYELIQPELRNDIKEKIQQIISTKSTLKTRMKLLCANRTYLTVEAYFCVWQKAHGEVYLNGYYWNIEETVALEQNYARNLAYRDVTGRNTIGSFHLNLMKNIVDDGISRKQCILDMGEDGTLDGFLKKSATMLDNQDAKETYLSVFSKDALIKAASEGRYQVVLEHGFTIKGESRRWIRTIVDLFKNPKTGDLEGFIYARNFTEEHLLGDMLNTVVNTGYDFVVLIDISTREYRTFVSKSKIVTLFKERGKYDSSLIDGLINLVYKDDRETTYKEMRLDCMIEKLKSANSFEYHYRIVRDDGIRNKKCTVSYLNESKNYVILSRIDETNTVTEMQTALNTAQKASEAKSEFLSHMSHEIRTPLNALLGMTQLAQDSLESDVDTTREYLNDIDNSGHYLLSVINDILDMSRIESGKFKLNYEWITIKEVLKPCYEMISPLIEEKKLIFDAPSLEKISEVCFFEMYGDLMKIRQLFLNLLNNACKFTQPGGTVSLKMRNLRHDENVTVDQIEISDTGCGMSEEFIKHMFTPFEQEKNEFSGTVRGTGLGLPIAKQIVEAMGGEISVESKLNVGTKFTLILPYRYRIIEKKEKDKEQNIDFSALRGVKVLLAEDNLINAKISQKLLENRGVVVTWVKDGKQALDAFESSEVYGFDAILMDVRMPIMDGLQATQKIRKTKRADYMSVPIIAMSANAFSEDVQSGMNAGMTAYLSKPVDASILYETLLAQISKVTQNKL